MRILIVDDEEAIREMYALGAMQATEGNCNIIPCGDLPHVEEVLAHAKKMNAPFDLVFTDYNLNDKGEGARISQMVKSEWPDTPVIMITGDLDSDRKNITDFSKADLYFQKPIDLNVIKEAVKHVASRLAHAA